MRQPHISRGPNRDYREDRTFLPSPFHLEAETRAAVMAAHAELRSRRRPPAPRGGAHASGSGGGRGVWGLAARESEPSYNSWPLATNYMNILYIVCIIYIVIHIIREAAPGSRCT